MHGRAHALTLTCERSSLQALVHSTARTGVRPCALTGSLCFRAVEATWRRASRPPALSVAIPPGAGGEGGHWPLRSLGLEAHMYDKHADGTFLCNARMSAKRKQLAEPWVLCAAR